MAAKCSLEVERMFGPIVRGCGSNFDFTLLFEETILFIGPLCFTIMLAAHRLWQLRSRQVVVHRGLLYLGKIVAYSSLVVVQALLLALITSFNAPKTQVTLAAVSIGLAGSIFLLAVSCQDHRRSSRPSSILTLYLLASLPMNALRARTMWNMEDNRKPAITFITFTILIACTLVLELLKKRSLLVHKEDFQAAEDTSGIVERSFAIWLVPLFRAGYHKKLTLQDLIPVSSRLSNDLIDKAQDKHRSSSLLLIVIKAHWSELLQPVLPRLLNVALIIAQAFLVERATEYMTEPVGPNTYKKGGGLIVAYFLVYVGIGTTYHLYTQKTAVATTIIRAGLVTQIQQRSLALDMAATSQSSSSTLMSADVERIQLGFRRIHEIWANLIQAGIGLWLVEVKLGVSMYPVMALTIGCIVLNYIFSRMANGTQRVWMGATQKRVAKTIKVLTGIKGIKMTGCGPLVQRMLTDARTAEVKLSKDYRCWGIGSASMSYLSLAISPALGIGINAILSRSHPGVLLNASTSFSSLTLLAVISTGLSNGLNGAFQFQTALSCLQRINSFLNQNERAEVRNLPGNASSGTLSSGKSKETGEKSTATSVFEDTTESADVAIRLNQISAKWEAKQAGYVLKDVSISVPRGKLTVVTGPTGCGKSTLLQTILGEVRYVTGSIVLAERTIGYCDQTPWLANTSIRKNILGACEFDPERYHDALRVCALERDLSELTGGDESLCGSSGISLSGGQKARIALARAIYAAPPVIALDDCFIGLDVETENRVLAALFGPGGILTLRGTTIVLATSSTKHLSWANHVVLMGIDGRVIRQGADDTITAEARTALQRFVEQEKPLNDKPEGPATIKPNPKPNVVAVSDWSVYTYFFQGIGWVNLGIFVILMVGFVVGTTYPQIYLKSWAAHSADEQRSQLPTLLGVFFGVGGIGFLSYVAAAALFVLRIQTRMSTVFHTRLLKIMLGAPMSFFTTVDSGVTLNRFSQDLQVIDREIAFGFVGVTVAAFQLIAQCIVIILGSNWSGIAIPALFVVIAAVQHVYLKTSQQLRLRDLEAKAPLFTHFLETLSGLVTVRAFGWTAEYARRGIEAMKRSQQPFYLLYSAQNTLTLVLDLTNATLAVIVISIAVGTRSSGSGGLGLALFNIVNLGQSIKSLVFAWTSLEVSLGAVARIRDFEMNTKAENSGTDRQPPDNWPQKGEIRFDNVALAYSDNDEPVISDLNLHIKPGWKVGICGRTGSGKSTLISSLLQLVDLRSGSISIDGLQLAGLVRDSVRSRIVVIPQEPFMLLASLRENMNIRGNHSDQELIAALQETNLWGIFEQRQGLDTVVTDDILSHGQRQLLSFTIATLQKGSIVIMDEPTSQVDADIQQQMHRAVFEDFADCTVICIAHRLETLLHFDYVAVLDEGRITEWGNPHRLLEQSGGSAFARMYHQSIGT